MLHGFVPGKCVMEFTNSAGQKDVAMAVGNRRGPRAFEEIYNLANIEHEWAPSSQAHLGQERAE
eukprot:1927419-Pyramimonas_sp.AAC.1